MAFSARSGGCYPLPWSGLGWFWEAMRANTPQPLNPCGFLRFRGRRKIDIPF